MSGGLRHSNGARGLLAVMLFLALAVRLVVPAGYMPTEIAKGLVITLCTADGAKTSVVVLPASGEEGDHGAPRDQQPAPCAFASLAAPALGGDAVAPLSVKPLPLREIALPPPAETLPASARFLLPPLRGPPSAA